MTDQGLPTGSERETLWDECAKTARLIREGLAPQHDAEFFDMLAAALLATGERAATLEPLAVLQAINDAGDDSAAAETVRRMCLASVRALTGASPSGEPPHITKILRGPSSLADKLFLAQWDEPVPAAPVPPEPQPAERTTVKRPSGLNPKVIARADVTWLSGEGEP